MYSVTYLALEKFLGLTMLPCDLHDSILRLLRPCTTPTLPDVSSAPYDIYCVGAP